MKKEKDIINHEHSDQGLLSFSSKTADFVQKLLGDKGFVTIDILKNWSNIVGEDLSKDTLPEKLDFPKDSQAGGTLLVSVSSGALALELQHKTPIVLEKINTYFGYKAVDHIKIIQSNQKFEQKEDINIADIEKKKLVTKEEQNYIENITREIENEELREKLQSFIKAVLLAQKKES